MNTRFWYSKNLRLQVTMMDEPKDGKLFDVRKMNGEPYENAGILIKSFKSAGEFWGRCLEKEEFGKRCAASDYSRTPEYRALKAQRDAERKEAADADAKAAFDALCAAGQPILTTPGNIAVVLRYLNTKNWGGWDLPKMSIPYACNQYDCDGKTATTMTLDAPIYVDGEMISRFQYGAPRGHLTKYYRV